MNSLLCISSLENRINQGPFICIKKKKKKKKKKNSRQSWELQYFLAVNT